MIKKLTLLSSLLLVMSCLDDLVPGSDKVENGGNSGVMINCDETVTNLDTRVEECQMLMRVNQFREKGADCGSEGVFETAPSLTMNSLLLDAARLHSLDMAKRNYFSHDSPGGPEGDDFVERIESAGYLDWMILGENIACGGASADAIVEGLMASDDHCANIMSPRFTDIGVGYVDNGQGDCAPYWTQDFGQLQ